LETLLPSGLDQDDIIGKFVAVRQISGPPVTVSVWDTVDEDFGD
jgi:hypothetical protein